MLRSSFDVISDMRVKETAQEKLKHNELFNSNAHEPFGSSLDYTVICLFSLSYLTTHMELNLWTVYSDYTGKHQIICLLEKLKNGRKTLWNKLFRMRNILLNDLKGLFKGFLKLSSISAVVCQDAPEGWHFSYYHYHYCWCNHDNNIFHSPRAH